MAIDIPYLLSEHRDGGIGRSPEDGSGLSRLDLAGGGPSGDGLRFRIAVPTEQLQCVSTSR